MTESEFIEHKSGKTTSRVQLICQLNENKTKQDKHSEPSNSRMVIPYLWEDSIWYFFPHWTAVFSVSRIKKVHSIIKYSNIHNVIFFLFCFLTRPRNNNSFCWRSFKIICKHFLKDNSGGRGSLFKKSMCFQALIKLLLPGTAFSRLKMKVLFGAPAITEFITHYCSLSATVRAPNHRFSMSCLMLHEKES